MVTRQRIDRLLPIQEIKADPRNARTHSQVQIRQIAESIKALGFGAPVLVDETLTLIGGYGRLKAAERLNIAEIPAVQLLGLSEAQKRALALADNKIGDNAGWDRARLAIELPDLAELLIKENLDISVTGFSPVEIDQLQIDFEEDWAIRATRSIVAGKRARWSASKAVCGSWISTGFCAGTRAAKATWIASWGRAKPQWHSSMCPITCGCAALGDADASSTRNSRLRPAK